MRLRWSRSSDSTCVALGCCCARVAGVLSGISFARGGAPLLLPGVDASSRLQRFHAYAGSFANAQHAGEAAEHETGEGEPNRERGVLL